MPFTIYLDGQLTDQPDGLSQGRPVEPITNIRRDEVIGALLVTQDVRLRYSGNTELQTGEISGYTYLRDLFEGGICDTAELTMYQQNSEGETFLHYSGTIKVHSIQFNLQDLIADTVVYDNSYNALIKNNQNIKVDFGASESKNKLNIDQLPLYQVDMFAGTNGLYGSMIGVFAPGYRIRDVFRFIVAAITDNGVGFESDYLVSSEVEVFLFKGLGALQVSFQDVLTEINKLKNIAFYIDYSDPALPVLRLENAEALFGGSTGINFDGAEIKELKVSVSSNDIYARVNVGSRVTIDGLSPWYTFNESTSYYGWKIETFHPLGQCNEDKELDLINQFIISNNVIQDLIEGSSTAQLESYFLIECHQVDDTAFTAVAMQYNFFGASPPRFLYNLGLNNYSKLTRHSTKFQTNLSNFLGLGGLGFRALLGDEPLNNITYSNAGGAPNYVPPTAGLTVDPAEYPNETTSGGYDGSGNYNNVAFEYTIPVDGDYSFSQRLRFLIAGIYRPSIYVTITLTINHYDSAMVLKSSGSQPMTYHNDGPYSQDFSYALSGETGDIVRASYRIQFLGTFGGGGSQPIAQQVQVNYDSYFECNGTPDGGITIASSSAGDIKVLEYEFEYDINDTDYRTIIANPTGTFEINKDGAVITGWLSEFQRNDETGRTKIKLITSANLVANALIPE